MLTEPFIDWNSSKIKFEVIVYTSQEKKRKTLFSR